MQPQHRFETSSEQTERAGVRMDARRAKTPAARDGLVHDSRPLEAAHPKPTLAFAMEERCNRCAGLSQHEAPQRDAHTVH